MQKDNIIKDDLRELIHSLSPAEVKYVGKVLIMQSGRKENLQLQLLRIIDKDKKNNLDEKGILKKLYPEGAENRTSYRMLKSRLKYKVIDAITHESNIERYTELEQFSYIAIKVRKKLSQFAFLLNTRPKQQVTIQLMEEIISLCKKHERFQTLIEVLFIKKYMCGGLYGKKAYKKIDDEIQYWEKCNVAFNTAMDVGFLFYLNDMNSSGFKDLKVQNDLLKNIELLKKLYSETKVTVTLLKYLAMEAEYFIYIREYRKAIVQSDKLISAIKEKGAVYRNQRLGVALINRAAIEVFLGNTRKAHEYAIQSRQYFKPYDKNYSISRELEFLNCFYSNRPFDFNSLMSLLPKEKDLSLWKYHLGKNLYYKAILYFKAGRFKETLQEIRSNTYLSDDKTGWDFGLRVLLIMTFIELGNFDEASSAIEALRKHVDRSSKTTFMRTRDKLIFDFIRSLDNNSFDFQRTANKKQKLIEQLESKEKQLAWEYFTHELFPFQDWVKSKLNAETLMFSKAI